MPRPPCPFVLSQTIIDGQEPETNRPIPAQTIQEASLAKSDLFQTFDHALPLDVSPGFSVSGQLVALAIADAKECRIIEFDKKPKETPDIAENREKLQDKTLCSFSGDLLAFDMAPLAMAIHRYLYLCVVNAIDIQSGFPDIDRQPISAIEKALSASVKINRENIRSLNHVYDEADKNRTPDLAMELGSLATSKIAINSSP